MSEKTKFETVDAYIGSFPQEVQAGLEQLRETIRQAVPEAEEVISYQLPAFQYHGMLIYYSAYKNHYSLSFPPPFRIFEAFQSELAPYEVSKTTIQLPMDRPLPLDLVSELAKYRARENEEKAAKKKKK
ncbi:iron chaperone [Cohnella sp. REN36]|uniref:iron chaperone n=1 Tax=Cohnella sp. REN36 TaxID=2887347 RepID=UPI001D156C6E|nr:DUF1801 domain-containing protein [Cohnella sp. REN36]MCC3375044.1 DUF1801 domain-containing protein [Cohnella sp. REN36]